jgi:hypothetical protein
MRPSPLKTTLMVYFLFWIAVPVVVLGKGCNGSARRLLGR